MHVFGNLLHFESIFVITLWCVITKWVCIESPLLAGEKTTVSDWFLVQANLCLSLSLHIHPVSAAAAASSSMLPLPLSSTLPSVHSNYGPFIVWYTMIGELFTIINVLLSGSGISAVAMVFLVIYYYAHNTIYYICCYCCRPIHNWFQYFVWYLISFLLCSDSYSLLAGLFVCSLRFSVLFFFFWCVSFHVFFFCLRLARRFIGIDEWRQKQSRKCSNPKEYQPPLQWVCVFVHVQLSISLE